METARVSIGWRISTAYPELSDVRRELPDIRWEFSDAPRNPPDSSSERGLTQPETFRRARGTFRCIAPRSRQALSAFTARAAFIRERRIFLPTRSEQTHQLTVAKTNYLSNSDDGFAHQLQTFASAIGLQAAGLGVTPAQVAAQVADTNYFGYALQCQEIVQNASKQWTAWKDIERRGGNVPPTGVPVVPVFPETIPAVAPGIEVRFRALVKQIKASADHNVSAGQALGIEGTPQVGPDYATLAPVLGLSISGAQVTVDWGWQSYRAFLDQCELQVNRGDGKGMGLLAIDTTSGYTDIWSARTSG